MAYKAPLSDERATMGDAAAAGTKDRTSLLRVSAGVVGLLNLGLLAYLIWNLVAGASSETDHINRNWIFLLAGLYCATGLPALVLTVIDRAPKLSLLLALLCPVLIVGPIIALRIAVDLIGA
jgi:hypothetical protein